MAKPTKKLTLKQLQKVWYDKLKNKTDFVDIEHPDNSLKKLSGYARQITSQVFNTADHNKAEYYRLAEHFLNAFEFKTNLDKVIWEYHSNGLSYRNIARVLSHAKVSKKSRYQIEYVILKLRKKMFEMYNVTSRLVE